MIFLTLLLLLLVFLNVWDQKLLDTSSNDMQVVIASILYLAFTFLEYQ